MTNTFGLANLRDAELLPSFAGKPEGQLASDMAGREPDTSRQFVTWQS